MSNCEDYATAWVPDNKFPPYNEQLELALYPLAEFILRDDTAWGEFVDFFTSGTPYIDCYGIRKDFEDGRF